MERLTLETVMDARWFPLRLDVESERFQFVQIAPEMHRAITFLNDVRPLSSEIRSIPWSDAADVPISEGDLHLILHSGLGGSTLLARLLGQAGVVTTLKEPPILTDVIAFGLRGRSAEAERRILREVARLLSRPFAAGETVVAKMSSVGNDLVSAIAEDRPRSQILCLQTPLETMLASLASRGAEGRLGGRKLFTGLRNAGMIKIETGDAQAAGRSDLELAALAWLATQRMMLEAAAKFGRPRVRSLVSERLISQPREALAAVARHFALALDVEARLASGILQRHAKTGLPFDAQRRAEQLKTTLGSHGEEIRTVVNWARKVADANTITWDLPDPLLD